MAALREAFVSGPHTSSLPLQMLPGPMHYGWTRDPSKIEAGWGGQRQSPPAPSGLLISLGSPGGQVATVVQTHNHSRDTTATLSGTRTSSPALPAPAVARISPKRWAPWLWSWSPASGCTPAQRQVRSEREDFGAPRVQPARGLGLSPYFPKPTAAGEGVGGVGRASGYGRLVLSFKCTEKKRGDAAASRGFCN